MQSFKFDPATTDIPVDILNTKSTVVKVVFSPNEIYVDAHLVPPATGNEGSWTVNPIFIPRQTRVPLEEQDVKLCLTKGELGRVIGMVDLGKLG
jgi:hypothetical protein